MYRQRDQVYESREAALADGWPDAEFGWWVPSNGDLTKAVEGWIALDHTPQDVEATDD